MKFSYQENRVKKFSFEVVDRFICANGQEIIIDQKQINTIGKIKSEKGRKIYAESIYANQNGVFWFKEISSNGNDLRRFQQYIEKVTSEN